MEDSLTIPTHQTRGNSLVKQDKNIQNNRTSYDFQNLVLTRQRPSACTQSTTLKAPPRPDYHVVIILLVQ